MNCHVTHIRVLIGSESSRAIKIYKTGSFHVQSDEKFVPQIVHHYEPFNMLQGPLSLLRLSYQNFG